MWVTFLLLASPYREVTRSIITDEERFYMLKREVAAWDVDKVAQAPFLDLRTRTSAPPRLEDADRVARARSLDQ